MIFKTTLGHRLMAEQASDSQNQSELERYLKMAEALCNIALSEYGCTNFTSANQNDKEIAISYWQDTQTISR